jgi:hypothetical protein
MTKQEYIDRLIMASDYAREFAMSLVYVDAVLSTKYCYSLFVPEEFPKEVSDDEQIEIMGGRILRRKELRMLSPARTGDLLWIDGEVPSWINIRVVRYSSEYTEFEVMYCGIHMIADPDRLPPDIGMQPGNKLAPFRIRGASEEEWEIANQDA